MISDLDILRTAMLVIEHHGDQAWLFAARRADELLDKGDVEGRRVWLRIIVAIGKPRPTMSGGTDVERGPAGQYH